MSLTGEKKLIAGFLGVTIVLTIVIFIGLFL